MRRAGINLPKVISKTNFLILLFFLMHLVRVNGQNTEIPSYKGKTYYSFSAGVNSRLFFDSRVTYPTSVFYSYNFADSVYKNSTIGIYLNGTFHYPILKKANLSIGIVLNQRKFSNTIYADSSVLLSQFPVYFDKYKYNFYALEIPVSISYSISAFSFSTGLSIIPVAYASIKTIHDKEIVSKSSGLLLIGDYYFINGFNPFVGVSFEIIRSNNRSNHVGCDYEYLNEYGCVFKVYLEMVL